MAFCIIDVLSSLIPSPSLSLFSTFPSPVPLPFHLPLFTGVHWSMRIEINCATVNNARPFQLIFN